MNFLNNNATFETTGEELLSHFGIADYSVFIFMLVVCSCIGLFFGYQDHRKNRKRLQQNDRANDDDQALEYLVGGRNMQVFPVAMSLIASGLSGVTLLGMPTETFVYGWTFWFVCIPIILVGILTHFVVIPVFYELKILSVFEYVERRFDKSVRIYSSLLYILQMILILPIVIFAPALAFNQVTCISVHVISPIVCVVCIFYTLLGGIKAVVWTDFIQIILMYGSLILIIYKGTSNVGGLSVVIERNIESTRIEEPIWNVDPTIRHSFWSLMIGGCQFWLIMISLNQSMIQRYISLPTQAAAKKALYINIIGLTILVSFCCYNGLLIYATYYDCDPLTTGLAKAKDQLLPLFTMSLLRDIPGMSGLFIAGIFSASLSSLSTALNSISAVILEDFFKPNCKTALSESQTRYLMRATVFLFGALSVALVYVVEQLGSVLQLGMTVSIAASGPLMAIFIIGFFLPWIKPRGILIGANVGLAVAFYISIKAQTATRAGELVFETKPVSIEGCTYEFCRADKNLTLAPEQNPESFGLHKISYLYFSVLGSIITIFIAYVVSLFMGLRNPNEIDSKLLAPCIRNYFNSRSSYGNCIQNESVTYEFNVTNNLKK